MHVTCICPTFNRANLRWLLDESVECFLRQDYEDSDLLICNDTPGQTVVFDHPRVRIINLPYRFPNLGQKLRFMLDEAKGPAICRWDDDDISFPWRLSLSVENLGDKYEWRAENHWYYPRTEFSETRHPGNTHVFSIWRKELLRWFKYPVTKSGAEDQAFNNLLWDIGMPRRGDLLPRDKIFYVYRWNTGSNHLSGHPEMQVNYENIGKAPIPNETVEIQPKWVEDYLEMAKNAI